MANRVCLGQKNAGQYGLWVSKPGVNVLTAADNQLLFNSDWKTVQIAQTGRVTIPAGNPFPITITIADMGFRPHFEYFSNPIYLCIEVVSNTQLRLKPFDSYPPYDVGGARYLSYTIFSVVL